MGVLEERVSSYNNLFGDNGDLVGTQNTFFDGAQRGA